MKAKALLIGFVGFLSWTSLNEIMNTDQQMKNTEFINQKSLINIHHSNEAKNNFLPNTRISVVRH